METNYSIDYFIDKFEVIPEEMWCTKRYASGGGKYCAYGHCGLTDSISHTSEGLALSKISLDYLGACFIMSEINDGYNLSYQQSTPKARILAALYDVKKLQQPQHIDITKQLAVLPTPETRDVFFKMEVI